DYIDALDWAESIGGQETLIQRSNANFKAVEDFVNDKDWIDFLAKSPENRSNTSVCLTLPGLESAQIKKMTGLLEKEGVAYDIGAYRDAPPGLRVWCGATVEEEDVAALMPWLEWARGVVVEDAGKA
ncbi:serC, partial [Symbiodinium sp. KB8]